MQQTRLLKTAIRQGAKVFRAQHARFADVLQIVRRVRGK